MVNDALEPGSRVGNYFIDGVIGRGGFGTVYSAMQPDIHRRAAVKVLHDEASRRADLASRFKTEARAVNRIDSRHVVDIFSFGNLDDGRFFYIMELVEGASLSTRLKQEGRVPLAEALTLLDQVARALDAAHAVGIVHRDIKPANILLGRDDDGALLTKLADFGIAKLIDPDEGVAHKTKTGAPIGTPGYMSPEQCRSEPVDSRSDIYALGVVAFELLTGKPPFEAASPVKLMMMHASAPPPAASSIVPSLAHYDAPLSAMLHKEPSARPASAGAAVAALQAAAQAGAPPSMSDRPSAAEEATTIAGHSLARERAPSRRSAVAVSVVLLLAMVAITLALLAPDDDETVAAAPASSSTAAASSADSAPALTTTASAARSPAPTSATAAPRATARATASARRVGAPPPKRPPVDPPSEDELEF